MESESSEEEDSSSSGSGSDSESTITDSGTEEPSAKPVLKSLKIRQMSNSSEPIQSPLDIFLMAVESMSKTDPKIALHDHTYARPPMDLEGSSGLQLIAAAAAVVSPGLSRSAAGGGKTPLVSPVKAPRGRPPSQQRRGSSHSGQKLAPTFLTPTSGSSQHVSLQDKPQLRQRSRSLSNDKSRSSSVQSSRPTPIFSVCRSATRPPHITLSKGGKDVSSILSPGLLKSIAASNGSSSSSSCSQNALDALVAITAPDTASSAANNALFATNTSSGSKSVLTTNIHQRKDGAVLELNLNSLGNMALLLAANQQTALLLPTLGKLPANTTLASLLQSGNAVVSISDSVHGNQSIGQTGAQSSAILHLPKIPPEIPSKLPGPPNTDSIPLVNPTIPVVTESPPLNNKPSSQATTTSEDFSNLNLLSSLVANLSPCKQPVVDRPPLAPRLTTPPVITSSSPSSPSSTKPLTPPPPKPSSLPLSTDDDKWTDSTSEWKEEKEEDTRPHVTSLSTISQQSLMLYTSSLSLSKHSPTTSSPEEDHLEYATRGISELSKLLGTDNGLESPASSDNSNNNSLYKMATATSSSGGNLWNPDDLLVNPLHNEPSTHCSKASAGGGQVYNRTAAHQ